MLLCGLVQRDASGVLLFLLLAAAAAIGVLAPVEARVRSDKSRPRPERWRQPVPTWWIRH